MDYVLRGSIDLQRLARVLSAALERNSLQRVTELLRDPLTELYTRDGLLTVGSRRQDEAHGNGGALVLVCALFDNLQTLREELGPGAADRALHDVASLLKGCCRRSDVVARLGEAHFAILGVDAAAPSAQVMRNRLEQHLAVLNRTRLPQDAVELRTSIGSWSAQDERSFADFLDSVQSPLVLASMGMKTKSVPEGNRIRV
jgi:diguanylate cyclase (GGDEF)-like protein